MQKKGLEPSGDCSHMDLNHARLPIPPLLHTFAILRDKTNKVKQKPKDFHPSAKLIDYYFA